MTRPIRLGAVSYLNVRPLVHGLGRRSDVTLRFDVPSVCAALLDQGAIDLGMVPSITYLDRPGDRIVPGVCIGSEGPVASVALFTRRPIATVRTIALDTSSRTSAALVRILCRRVFRIAPTFVPYAPGLETMLAAADAALVIGDPALFVDHRSFGAEKIDLGDAWTTMTGLPFVWAFWAGRPDAVDAGAVAMLQRTAETGIAHIDDIAERSCAETPVNIPAAREYLRHHLAFRLTSRALEGLQLYYREAVAAGAAPVSTTPIFFDAPPAASDVPGPRM